VNRILRDNREGARIFAITVQKSLWTAVYCISRCSPGMERC